MRKLRITVVLSGVFSISLFQAPSSAGPTSYTVIDLSPSNFTFSVAYGIDAGQQVGYGSGGPAGNGSHALMWSGSAASAVDLNGVFGGSVLYAINGGQQVGSASVGGQGHAILWTGTAASAVDLHPTGFISSTAVAVGGGLQGGYGYGPSTGNLRHALLWSGTAASAIDLNPTGYDESSILAVGGGQQGGYALAGRDFAMLWTGTAASAVNLNPAGSTASEIFAVGGGLQVGEAGNPITGRANATLWSGTAASAIDLHPAGFLDSYALAIGDGEEVGYAYSPTIGTDAMVWIGTAASAVNLQQFLPAQYFASEATGIDSNGNIVGYAIDASQNYHAIEWIPAPEPTSLSLIGLGTIALLARKRGTTAPAQSR